MRTVATILTVLGWIFGLASGSMALWMGIAWSYADEPSWLLFWLSWVMIALSWLALSTVGQAHRHPAAASAELLVSGVFSLVLPVFERADSLWEWSLTPWPLSILSGVPRIAAGALVAIIAARDRVAGPRSRRLQTDRQAFHS